MLLLLPPPPLLLLLSEKAIVSRLAELLLDAAVQQNSVDSRSKFSTGPGYVHIRTCERRADASYRPGPEPGPNLTVPFHSIP